MRGRIELNKKGKKKDKIMRKKDEKKTETKIINRETTQ